MNKYKIENLLEYLSATLVISYFIIHSITLVIMGIVLSLFIINNNIIKIAIRNLYKKFHIEKLTKEHNKNSKSITADFNKNKSNKVDYILTLVEKVEELGYIPSADKYDDNNAA